MPRYASWIRWSALTGMCGQCLFLLGFILPYATLASGEQRWLLLLTPSNLLSTLQQGDFSVLFWTLLIFTPWALYLLILLTFKPSAPGRRGSLLLASTLFITGLTFIAGVLLAFVDILILFYNSPPMRYRPPIPPIRYSGVFWLPLLGTWLSWGASLALLSGLVLARRAR